MPVTDCKTYCRMIDHAIEKKFAYPAIIVISLTTANGILKGLAESRSDGIIQVSTGECNGQIFYFDACPLSYQNKRPDTIYDMTPYMTPFTIAGWKRVFPFEKK